MKLCPREPVLRKETEEETTRRDTSHRPGLLCSLLLPSGLRCVSLLSSPLVSFFSLLFLLLRREKEEEGNERAVEALTWRRSVNRN